MDEEGNFAITLPQICNVAFCGSLRIRSMVQFLPTIIRGNGSTAVIEAAIRSEINMVKVYQVFLQHRYRR